jgi:hypothetical protein
MHPLLVDEIFAAAIAVQALREDRQCILEEMQRTLDALKRRG